MNAITLPRRRAVVFSAYPEALYTRTVLPKLERYNIEVVRRIDPTKDNSFNVEDADLVLHLQELINPNDAKRIKEAAKKFNKQYVLLYRRIAEWDRAFNELQKEVPMNNVRPISRPVETTKAVKPVAPGHPIEPVSPSKPPPPPSKFVEAISASKAADEDELTLNETKEMLTLYEETNVKLDTQVTNLSRRLNDAEDRAEEWRKKAIDYEAANKSLTEANKALGRDGDAALRRLTQVEEELRLRRLEVADQAKYVNNAQAEVKSSRESNDRNIREIKALKESNQALVADVAKYKKLSETVSVAVPIVSAPPANVKNPFEEFFKSFDAFATLVDQEMIDAKDAFKKLFNIRKRDR